MKRLFFLCLFITISFNQSFSQIKNNEQKKLEAQRLKLKKEISLGVTFNFAIGINIVALNQIIFFVSILS